jgi:GTP-binding protein
VQAGDIAAIAGIEDIGIGDTITDREKPLALPPLRIDEPTIAMLFIANNSPWSGREGEHVTSRKLRERLFFEARRNVSLRSKRPPRPMPFKSPAAANSLWRSSSRPCAAKATK